MKLLRLFLPCLLCLPWFSRAADVLKPNVLFIAVDDLKPVLGCYGDKLVKSPNIDRLAARGVVFERAYCNQAVCAPSRNSLLTGVRPTTLGIYDLGTNFRRSSPKAVTLPQYFIQHGYRAEALGKIFHVGHGNHEDPASWSVPHFQEKSIAYVLPASKDGQPLTREEAFFANRSPANLPRGAAYESPAVPDTDYPDGRIANEAIRRLQGAKAKPNEPFFLAVGFLKPHLPFCSPKKYWDLYDRAAFTVPSLRTPPEGAPKYAPPIWGELRQYSDMPTTGPVTDEQARTLIHGYHAAVSFMDAQLGRVLDELDRLALTSNTIIVLWGDHGWQLGDHGLWHKHTNYELATRAPLLISVPKQKTAGQKCQAPVEFVDVYPTLADLCGLPKPTGLAGSSLKPFIENPATPMAKVAISQYPRNAGQAGAVMGYSIRDERWRATFWRERNGSKIVATELYDEQNDPAETVSLHDRPEHKTLLETLAKNLPAILTEPAPAKASSKKNGKAAPAKSAAAPAKTADAATADERGPKFDKLDAAKAGKITRDYYTSHQSDAKAAGERFDKWDANRDGFLTRQEFVTQGGKYPNAK